MAIVPPSKKPDEDKEPTFDIHVDHEPHPEEKERAIEALNRALEREAAPHLGRAFEDVKRNRWIESSRAARTGIQDHYRRAIEEAQKGQREMHRLLSDSVHVMPAIRPPQRMEVELSARDRADADRRAGLADAIVAGIMQRVAEFQDTLADDEEVVVVLANFGTGISIHVEFIYWEDSHLLIFDGVVPNGGRVRLMQHAAQCNLLLCANKVAPEEDRPARRIGFQKPSGA